MDDLLFAAACVVVIGVLYYGWEITFGTARYRRMARESRKRSSAA